MMGAFQDYSAWSAQHILHHPAIRQALKPASALLTSFVKTLATLLQGLNAKHALATQLILQYLEQLALATLGSTLRLQQPQQH